MEFMVIYMTRMIMCENAAKYLCESCGQRSADKQPVRIFVKRDEESA